MAKMTHSLRYTSTMVHKLPLLNRNICDKRGNYKCIIAFRYNHRNYDRQAQPTTLSTNVLQDNIKEAFQKRFNWTNQQYERVFGIAEIRDMQNKVLEAEHEFVKISEMRKSSQDQIDHLKDSVKNLREKLESTPRSSENYIELIKIEHKLLKQQLALDEQFAHLKEKEQLSFDGLSKLLRQSHELERLRQERSKYWQIISVALSLVASLVALMAQRARNQNSTMKQLSSFETKFIELNHCLENSYKESDKKLDYIYSSIAHIDTRLSRIEDEVKTVRKGIKTNNEGVSRRSWSYYIPGLATLSSWFYGI